MTYRITVIGGANVDIGGRPAAALALRDSNPGTVSQRYGGVGRNIAHNLCLLGQEVHLITALGGDLYGDGLRESCRALGMDLSMSLVLPDRRSSTYLYVTDESGDMHVGISDMEITRCLTPEVLEPHREAINASDAVIVDANLEAETLCWIGENLSVPLYADPVSTAKAPRLKALLPRLRALKPNGLEALALTGEHDSLSAIRALQEQGVQRVFLSLGAHGMIAAEGEELVKLPCVKMPVVNTTGAGDAALAALVWADLHGGDLECCARTALLVGAITSACPEANNPELGKLLKNDTAW